MQSDLSPFSVSANFGILLKNLRKREKARNVARALCTAAEDALNAFVDRHHEQISQALLEDAFEAMLLSETEVCARLLRLYRAREDESEQRLARRSELASMPYTEYLQTQEWKEHRQFRLNLAGNACEVCNSPENLHVHHRTYERRGAEHFRDLIVLCAECHELFHKNGRLAG